MCSFGFRFGALNGCLLAALALNATLIFDNDALYRERADFGIDPNTFDELLRLNRALPTAHDVSCTHTHTHTHTHTPESESTFPKTLVAR